jgi:hypothetical protein
MNVELVRIWKEAVVAYRGIIPVCLKVLWKTRKNTVRMADIGFESESLYDWPSPLRHTTSISFFT